MIRDGSRGKYRELRPESLRKTLKLFSKHISEKFPGSGLSAVSAELEQTAEVCISAMQKLRRPSWGLRITVTVCVLLLISLPLDVLLLLQMPIKFDSLSDFTELMQATDAGFNLMVLLAGAALFLISMESRMKRKHALGVLDELRSLAHVVDMHQLNKDPAMHIPLVAPEGGELQKGQTIRSAADLWYYLSFCTDLLSIVGKLAALFAQGQTDRVVLDTINEIETISTALSRKIWQKMTLVKPPHPSLQAPGARLEP